MRSLLLVVAYLAFFVVGMSAPFVLTLGFVWVDILQPANIVWGGALSAIPLSFILGAAAVAGYLLLDRRAPPRIGAVIFLTVALGLWVTATTFWAVLPDNAWGKWDWAFKTVMFSAFLPFVIRTRNQIEAFVQIYVFSLAAHIIPYGTKTFLTGGGYGQSFGLISGNASLGEGDTLAVAALVSIPMIFFLMSHSRIVPNNIWTKSGYIGLVILALTTAVGTHERAALLGMIALAATQWWKSRRKVLFGAFCLVAAGFIMANAPASWLDRMGTIGDYQTEDSANIRLAVWKWTLGYVKEHPFGGGFEVYRINAGQLPIYSDKQDETNGQPVNIGPRAFHSIYFEVLGEHGWIGLVLYLGLFAGSLWSLRQVARRTKKSPHLRWIHDLAKALQVSLVVLMVVGTFAGIAFAPFVYYLFALSVSLKEYVRRIQTAAVPSPSPAIEGFGMAPGYPT